MLTSYTPTKHLSTPPNFKFLKITLVGVGVVLNEGGLNKMHETSICMEHHLFRIDHHIGEREVDGSSDPPAPPLSNSHCGTRI